MRFYYGVAYSSADKNPKNMNKEKILNIIKFIVLLLIVVGIPLYLWVSKGDIIRGFKTVDDIESYILASRNAPLAFFGLQVLQIVIAFIPGEVFQIAAGYLFGPFQAIMITLVGCIVGSIICFYLARLLGQGFLRLFFKEEKIEYYQKLLNSNKGSLICFLLFLIPGIPKDILNYAAGASEIKFLHFIVLSSVGRLPAMIGSIIIGSLAEQENYTWAVMVVFAATIILVVCILFRKQIMNKLEHKKDKPRDHCGLSFLCYFCA